MAQSNHSMLTYDDYGVAIICPLEVEMSAMRYMLDEEHTRLPNKEGDSNRYVYGRMSNHNVVIAYLPRGSQGVGAAATVATNMKRTFSHASLRLLVGIGGGVPSHSNDIRLGDVVISMPTSVHGGVVQYDLGKETVSEFERKGSLELPPTEFRTAVVEMQSKHRVRGNQIATFINQMLINYPSLTDYARPRDAEDVLFVPTSEHIPGELTCKSCNFDEQSERPHRLTSDPKLFYGLIASGNRVIKNARLRDVIAKDAGGAMCFEMEAAGLMNDFRCLVIRGISDYADSHKNDDWHAYAAATAAGSAKELLTYMDTIVGTHSLGQNQHWTVSRAANPHFTGRVELVAEIEDMIRHSLRGNVITQQCRIIITGMGGQGKSELCLHIANRVRSWFWGVFWVDVNTSSSAESGFAFIANRLNCNSSTTDAMCQHLANSKQSWLLILDNADDRDFDYQQYFPSGSAGVVMLTSRNKECNKHATQSAIALEGLSSYDACALLIRSIETSQSRFDDEALHRSFEPVAMSLLNGHPLAITQAGAYIAQGHCSVAQYPRVFERQRKRLLTFRPKQAQSRYGDVYATFEASAEILQSSTEEAASDALQLLSILSMLAPNPLPLLLFEGTWRGARAVLDIVDAEPNGLGNQLGSWHIKHLPPMLGAEQQEWDSFRLVEAVRSLEAYSLINVSGSGDSMSVSMHPLAHGWAKDRQQLPAQRRSWLTTGLILAFSERVELVWQLQQHLRPHLPSFLTMESNIMFESGPPLMIVPILCRIGQLLRVLRLDRNLSVLCKQIVRWLRIDSMTVDRDWYFLYELIAASHYLSGEPKEAIHLLEQVVEIYKQTQAEDHPDRLISQYDLAVVYSDNGKSDEAVLLLEQVVRIQEQKLTEDHLALLVPQHELARAYAENGQADRALPLLEHVVRIREQTLIEDHPNRLTSQQVLAAVLWRLGEDDKAYQMMRHVATIRKGKLDASHPERRNAEKWLAIMEEELELSSSSMVS